MTKNHTSTESTSYESSSFESDTTWLTYFKKSRKSDNHLLLSVPAAYLGEKFNMIDLPIQNVDSCCNAVLGNKYSKSYAEEEVFYYLMHQRYVLTSQGIEKLYSRIKARYYGVCRNVSCKDSPYIPYGKSREPGISLLCFYCYKCNTIYKSTSKRGVDGCAFGPDCAMFLITSYRKKFKFEQKNDKPKMLFGFVVYEEDMQ